MSRDCRSSRRSCVDRPRRRRFTILLFVFAALVGVTGCLVHTEFGAAERRAQGSESRSLPVVGTRRVLVKTANGNVQVRPARDGVETIEVRAIKDVRLANSSHDPKFNPLEQVEIATPVSGSSESTQEITWAWSTPQEYKREATVSFEIVMPPSLDLAVETENGQIDVVGIVGDCQVRSENGPVRVVAAVGLLQAQSVNGGIEVETPASNVDLQATNGTIKAKLSNPDHIDGTIKSENGDLDVYLAKTVSVDIDAASLHGKINEIGALNLTGGSRSSGTDERGQFQERTGHLGSGGGLLKLRTENGNLTLGAYRPGDRK